MTQRIKELSKKAYEEVIRNTPSFLVTKEMYEQKFAELIVADCVAIIESYFDESPEIMGLPLDILEHFDMELPE